MAVIISVSHCKTVVRILIYPKIKMQGVIPIWENCNLSSWVPNQSRPQGHLSFLAGGNMAREKPGQKGARNVFIHSEVKVKVNIVEHVCFYIFNMKNNLRLSWSHILFLLFPGSFDRPYRALKIIC